MSEKLTVLTAYDFNTARALAEAGVDYILVGDSLAMVAFGHSHTNKVSLGEMLVCTRAVRRGAPEAQIITDLPFSAIHKNMDDTIKAVKQIIKAGANIIKIENAQTETIELIGKLQKLKIPVMGHIGYTPQTYDKPVLVKDRERLIQEAKQLQDEGVMAIVLEMLPNDIAKEITEALSIPTIGIGAGVNTSGQVLVSDDMLGRYNLIQPKFLRRYANQYEEMVTAFKAYIADVRAKDFPNASESYEAKQLAGIEQ